MDKWYLFLFYTYIYIYEIMVFFGERSFISIISVIGICNNLYLY